MTQPGAGTVFAAGTPIGIAASASDGDGTVTKVEFFAGSIKIGESLQSPYAMVWTNAPVGSASLTARATDDDGASTTSAPIALSVVGSGQGGSVLLQRGSPLNTAVADTYLSSYHPTLSFGTTTATEEYLQYYRPLLRFAIFQGEGGPVPQGAVISSAVLSVYKYSSYDMTYALHPMLKAWSESAATWNAPGTGGAWSVAGANGFGTDYGAVPSASASTGFNPGWVQFDVTGAVATMSSSSIMSNHGWQLRGVSGYTNATKRFYSSEFSNASLRPKLVITYQ